MDWACSQKGEGSIDFKIVTGKRTRKRPLGRPRRRWEDNVITVIRLYIEKIYKQF